MVARPPVHLTIQRTRSTVLVEPPVQKYIVGASGTQWCVKSSTCPGICSSSTSDGSEARGGRCGRLAQRCPLAYASGGQRDCGVFCSAVVLPGGRGFVGPAPRVACASCVALTPLARWPPRAEFAAEARGRGGCFSRAAAQVSH